MIGVDVQLEKVRERIRQAALAANRSPDEVRLVAVTKTKPVEMIQTAYDAGQRIFGENRIQELEEKRPLLPDDAEWHMIGHVQSNKALKVVLNAAMIHSVDSVKLLRRLDRLADERDRDPRILLEINVSGENSKFGAEDDGEILRLAETAATAKRLRWIGLMTMAPHVAPELELRRVFAGLRELRDRLATRFGATLPELSMGMSSDYPFAIAEGATLVRVGSAIFGSR